MLFRNVTRGSLSVQLHLNMLLYGCSIFSEDQREETRLSRLLMKDNIINEGGLGCYD